MKKFFSLMLAFLLTVSLAGCAKKQTENSDTTSVKDASEILTTVWNSYAEENKFAAMGTRNI